MAKQSGLHQLRGKVGEHSYYRQTGIQSGLVRSINQGMSSRVKNDEAFANTRLNNAEFGQAGRIAKVLARLITPKYRPMILPFSQAKMCKHLLDSIKEDTSAPWGRRNIPSTLAGATVLVNALNSVRKNDPESYGVTISIAEDNLVVSTDETLSQAKLDAIGADGYLIRVVAASPLIGTNTGGVYALSISRSNIYDNIDLEAGGSQNVDYEFLPNPPDLFPAFKQDFFVVIILPYRKVNNTNFILQEHCTYFASEVPAQS